MQIRWVLVFPCHTHTELVSDLCRLGYTGGLAERRADGGEVERPTE